MLRTRTKFSLECARVFGQGCSMSGEINQNTIKYFQDKNCFISLIIEWIALALYLSTLWHRSFLWKRLSTAQTQFLHWPVIHNDSYTGSNQYFPLLWFIVLIVLLCVKINDVFQREPKSMFSCVVV